MADLKKSKKQTVLGLKMLLRCIIILSYCIIGGQANGSPPLCKDGKFFDVQNQVYFPCEKCEDNWMGCSICCDSRKSEMPTSPSSSQWILPVEDTTETWNQHVLKAFLYGFVLFVIASVLIVLATVVIKASRDRRAECEQDSRDRNSSNATLVCEVFLGDIDLNMTTGQPEAIDSQHDSENYFSPQSELSDHPEKHIPPLMSITVNKFPDAMEGKENKALSL